MIGLIGIPKYLENAYNPLLFGSISNMHASVLYVSSNVEVQIHPVAKSVEKSSLSK
jgi:hypothetical protein